MTTPVSSTISRVSGSPLITAPSQRLATREGRKGFDLARQMVDNLRRVRRSGQKPDLILVSKETDHLLKTAWLEMGMSSDTVPRDIDGVELMVGDTQGCAYAFLRNYIPWEKRKALKEGQMLYGDGKKKLIAVEH
jgi:hypothetical protein